MYLSETIVWMEPRSLRSPLSRRKSAAVSSQSPRWLLSRRCATALCRRGAVAFRLSSTPAATRCAGTEAPPKSTVSAALFGGVLVSSPADDITIRRSISMGSRVGVGRVYPKRSAKSPPGSAEG